MMDRNSIKVRFLSTFITNILRLGILFITGIIIARTLGPSEYGNFNFLLGSFTSLVTLVDMASSSAFYTFISQRKRGKIFFIYYANWVIAQLFILLIFTLTVPNSFKQKIWLGQSSELLILALFATFSINLIWRLAGQIGESIRDTVGVQIRNLTLAVAYLLCVVGLAGFDMMNIKKIFIVNIILYLFLSYLYFRRMCRIGIVTNEMHEDFKAIYGEYKRFCLPLVAYTIIGFIYSFADYWMLQKYGGSVQQGYYSIGYRFAFLSLIATTSILQIFWKEIAEAYSTGNSDKVRILYKRVSRGLYFAGAVISCVLIPFSKEILSLLLGAQYQAAWLPLGLMFLYPIHQSMGQITGTMLFATEKTKVKSIIGIFFMISSIVMAYFMLAPEDAIIPGLNMGAVGLALKMLICQFIEVNLMAFFVSRYVNLAFDWSHQLYVLLILLSLGFFCKFFVERGLSLFYSGEHVIFTMFGSGFLYLISVATLVRFSPSIAGFNKDQVDYGLALFRKRVNF